ncbi:MAG: RdgB/HAM1 family non-canonical purine NTP pyrophosphatase [Neomegalonema sp.]|nr:RdgB/HAM1 family non-canonical purine NTP pyrophosphatase [Neomegalonema sp.]
MARRFEGEKLLVASHNAGKVREIGELLAPYGIETVSAADLDLPAPEETESTFEGNARIKAHAAAKASGLPALSDDSGFSVAALDGAPGVYAADWAETPQGRDFGMAMQRVWDECEAKSAPEPRTAAFHCCLCLAWPDGHDEIFMGTVSGSITWPPRGALGFGYDPMFVRAGETRTFGEISAQEKHADSHRARAFALLVDAVFKGDEA